jgi:stage II sporulation protein M
MKSKLLLFFFLSTLIWCLPFFLRLFFIGDLGIVSSVSKTELTPSVFTKITVAYHQNNRFEIFLIIFTTNIKSCIYNILGGVTLGLGTLFNLIFISFTTADMFYNTYVNGIGIVQILKHTLPHSIEFIGIWLSGAIGFFIAKHIIDFMRGKEFPTASFLKFIGKYILITVLIILVAAFIEAYVSFPQLK